MQASVDGHHWTKTYFVGWHSNENCVNKWPTFGVNYGIPSRDDLVELFQTPTRQYYNQVPAEEDEDLL